MTEIVTFVVLPLIAGGLSGAVFAYKAFSPFATYTLVIQIMLILIFFSKRFCCTFCCKSVRQRNRNFEITKVVANESELSKLENSNREAAPNDDSLRIEKKKDEVE